MKADRQDKNFSTGLVLGLALGSTLSYFSSPAGQKTWKKLSQEWQEARIWLYEQKLIDDPDLSLDEFKEQFLLKTKQSVLGAKDGLDLLMLNVEQAKNKQKKRRQVLRRKKKSKFKGV